MPRLRATRDPQPSGPAPPKITAFLHCWACRERVEHPSRSADRGAKKPGYQRGISIGPPGEVFINNGGRALYQLIPGLHKDSAVCFQYATCLGPFWPIPFCEGCNCRQAAIAPGTRSMPFVDYTEEFAKLSEDQKHVALGAGNWTLLKSGLATWPDMVTTSRVREFHEVMDRKKLSVPQMIAAGVSEEYARTAWNLVYTPERLAADAKRSEAIRGLRGLGLSTQDIARAISPRMVGRTSRAKDDK